MYNWPKSLQNSTQLPFKISLWIQIHWTKSSLFWNSNPCLGFQKCPWLKVVDLNFNPSTKFQISYLEKGLNLSEFGNFSKWKSLDSNFTPKPKSIFDFWKGLPCQILDIWKYSNLSLKLGLLTTQLNPSSRDPLPVCLEELSHSCHLFSSLANWHNALQIFSPPRNGRSKTPLAGDPMPPHPFTSTRAYKRHQELHHTPPHPSPPPRIRLSTLQTSPRWTQCHGRKLLRARPNGQTPFRDNGNEASIRVPKMFNSHV
jgi:hypothetical protein